MVYLSVNEILVIHHHVVGETGGLQGIRDAGLLFSITQKPQTVIAGIEMYPGVFYKAAVLLEAIVNYHVFVDGNKRTAFSCTETFLRLNGHQLHVSMDKIYTFILSVATEKLSPEQIAAWLKKHSV